MQKLNCARAERTIHYRAAHHPAVIILILSLILPDLAANAAEPALKPENREGMQKAGAGWAEPVPEEAEGEHGDPWAKRRDDLYPSL